MKKSYLYLLAIMVISLLACGVSTSASQPAAAVIIANTPAPTAAVVVDRLPQTYPTAGRVLTVSAATLTVRECGSTDNATCPPLGYANEGSELTALGGNVWTGNPDCPQWLEVEWRGDPAWVCAAFVGVR